MTSELQALLHRIQFADNSAGNYTPRCPACGVTVTGIQLNVDLTPLPPGSHPPDCDLARLAGLPTSQGERVSDTIALAAIEAEFREFDRRAEEIISRFEREMDSATRTAESHRRVRDHRLAMLQTARAQYEQLLCECHPPGVTDDRE